MTQTVTAKASEASSRITQISEKTLENGLKVIVKPDHRAPVVISQVWYKVGSSYESGGTTGVSHVLEHMMFKGTEKYPTGEFNKIISRNGGEDNAFTSKDYTAYYQKLEKSRLKVSFEMESDRMRGLLLPKDEFDKEVMVVMEERRWRTDDKPQSLTYEQFYATAFDNSGYHNPTIGWMDDLKNMTVEDLNAWYQRYYAPNNATLVVVGDVEPEAVFTLAEHYFGSLKPFKIAKLKPRIEREQKGTKRIEMELEAKLPYMIMGYKVPVVNTAEIKWEPYALDLLAEILDGGDSARLSKNLIKGSKIATSAGAGYSMDARIQALFLLDGIPVKGTTTAELEATLLKELDDVKNNLVSEAELNRVKAQVILSAVYEQDSMFYQGMKIGIAETVGIGWQEESRYVEYIQAVTAEQIQQVAQKYFTPQTLTVATLKPIAKQVKEQKKELGQVK
ncbi:MAG: insulinase family protein [gamma proteobacterium symbiont of Lucinoma myriamae]|nr:insulinase family protein [gamma proteobacterium symbiont of Lucinoma myriamae]MCU7819872.1 insulinase family protein [gamma proteobacterium symbiont of Lucinoma myriamae]MCU7831701.1 insulinase family protein [gamma proteobacterium symbiont of Lucinoma myriamae]